MYTPVIDPNLLYTCKSVTGVRGCKLHGHDDIESNKSICYGETNLS